MAEYRFNLTSHVTKPPRVRGKFVAYRDRLTAALDALNDEYRVKGEERLRDAYDPHFTETWSSESQTAYPEFSFVVQSDSPYIHLMEADTRAGYWPPYQGPTKKDPDRERSRLWEWLQAQRGNPKRPASAYIVARAIFQRGTYGKYRLESAYYSIVREYGDAFGRVLDRVMDDVIEEAS